MLAAAVELLDAADLADVLSFLGTRRVADAAGVRPATVHHHFGNREPGAKSNARLAGAVLAAVLNTGEIDQRTIERTRALTQGGDIDADTLAMMREVATQSLLALLAARRGVVGSLLAAAVAPNDAGARERLQEHYGRLTADYARLFTQLAEQLDRALDASSGFDSETVTTMVLALTDGLLLRNQFDPDAIDPEVYGELVIRLFEAVTAPRDDGVPPAQAIAERLLSGVSTLGLPADSGLDHAKRNQIIEAVRALWDREGVRSLTVTAVAREANVSRGTVIANFVDRGGLAAAVWAGFVPELELRLQADRTDGMSLARIIERHLHRVVELAREHRELTGLMLEGVLTYTVRHGRPDYTDPADPRTFVPLPLLLVPVIEEHASVLRRGLADTAPDRLQLAQTITNLAFLRSMSFPEESASASVHHVMDALLGGILR